MATKKKRGAPLAPASPRPADSETAAEPAAPGFPVVGIGASAGGFAAFEAFFSGMPAAANPGMAFVLVQHLGPDHPSILATLVGRVTRMPVLQAEDGMIVQINCVYVIPPNRDMAFLNGALHLFEPVMPRGQRLPIDFLFRSLAEDRREAAIGIVLSGTGSDGTLGLRAIKDSGGMVMAQSPASTQFDGMPSSALATGLVDFELEPAEMPEKLIAYVGHALSKHFSPSNASLPKVGNALKKIFILLRHQTGHDFSEYKPSTTLRRIDRRMAVHQIDTLEAYVKYLQNAPVEVEALFRDMLIGVTKFFRDADAFTKLEELVIPKLFEGKPPGAVIRAWIAGCSTGEEAYSIAILLRERLEALKSNYKLQVFATDIDSRAIGVARAGVYPASIAADVSPERLARFFTGSGDDSGYRIHKVIRDMVVFSEHDINKDPNFSRVDLVSCRNLMIYLGGELQKKLIPMFHYALNAGGMLFLGTSESVGEFADLFATVDRPAKLYRRKDDGVRRIPLARLSSAIMENLPTVLPHAAGAVPAAKVSLREIVEQTLLRHVTPVGALVNGGGDILYLHGRSGMYLEPPSGETGTSNILRMAREGLRRHLAAALSDAASTKETMRSFGLRVRTNGHFTSVNLTVTPVAAGQAGAYHPPLYLVILEEMPAREPESAQITAAPEAQAAAGGAAGAEGDSDARVAALTEELRAKEEFLQAANEELETSNEELQSSNEEMQSVNEELQSANEELETSKEELQSINEELVTVNAELQAKLADLSRTSNDMSNLLASTEVGTVFVDHHLRVVRFTPSATRVINLIPGDVGRPLGHVVSNLLTYSGLLADTQEVLDTLVPKEVDVLAAGGAWFKMRILPYRTEQNVIEGAVITFMDITETMRTREALREVSELARLAVVVRDAHDAITVQDLDGHTLAWNPGAFRMYGWTEAEALRMNVRDRIPPEHRERALARAQQLSQQKILEPYRTLRITKKGEILEVWMTATALLNEHGRMYAIATTERALESTAGGPAEAQRGGSG